MRELSKSILKGAVKSFAITLVVCSVISIFMLFTDVSDSVLSYISLFLLGGMCYMTAYFSTQIKRNKGLVQGVLSGAGIFVVTFFISAISGNFHFTGVFFVKLLVCLTGGITGGVKGINTKHTTLHK